ncbi:response regulator transcription factor [Paenibacillus sp. SYP-B3998]|uniref:Response regulator transcription factor n=1 Tax=Paenibacillus sp. SYP-B3998 TaxID=2678564 RepID=A0A6G4A5M7_9BACL|nr:response regulator [Paenibacillus sp. SYP-B3998]NEW09109.1 response regulator transcription factor [Paenibacillus sp. SYP-B3998]
MRKVFFADDEPLIAKGMPSVVDWQQLGLTVAGIAMDGTEALAKLKDEPVDLLITDIMMPGLSGLDLIRKVKTMHPRTKFIVMSGYEEFKYVKEGITLGIENYILKPINIDELESTIKHILRDWEREEFTLFRSAEDWKVLRNNILQRWLSGEIEGQELKNRAALLGIPMFHAYYQVASLKIVYESELSSRLHRLDVLAEQCEKMAKEQLSVSSEVVCFPDGDDNLVVIFAMPDPDNEEACYLALERMVNWLSEVTGFPIWGVFDGSKEDYLSAANSYTTIKHWFQEHLLPSGDQTVFLKLSEKGEIERAAGKQPVGMEAFAQLLMEGQEERIHAYVEAALSIQQEDKELPPLRSLFFNVAIQLMLAAKDREKSKDYTEIFAPLSLLHTLSGLKNYVITTIDRTLERIHSDPQKAYSPHVAELLEYVHGHYQEELSLKTWGHKVELHPNYLGQLFHVEVGTSFSDYLNQYRIEKATHLLLYTDRKTAEIAQDVGYWDTSYFYRQFKKYAGVSPTELRSMYAKK